MTQRPFSLTERVVWAVTATVALLVGLQSVLAFVALHVQEDELTESMLRREVQQIIVHTTQPGLTPTGTLIDSARVSAWLTRDGSGAADIPVSMRTLAPGLYQFDPDGKTLHVAVTDTDDGRLTVVLDASEEETRVRVFGLTLFVLWCVCVAATVWIARAVAAVAAAPIVAAARSIAASAPGGPLADDDRSDEAGVLMATFGRFRNRVDDMVAREREFAANLDHEIRTPLTSIRTDAELLALEAAPPPAQRARLERIVAAVDEIGETIASALAYSAGRSAGREVVVLRDFLRAACDAFAAQAEAAGLRIAIEVAAGETVTVDRPALLMVVRNLVRNAIEHAAPATLTIGGDARGLRFEDDGRGIAAAARAHVFDRHRHGQRVDEGAAPGRERGLGLAIVRRICDLQGWRIEARPPDGSDRGAVFALDFSADGAP